MLFDEFVKVTAGYWKTYLEFISRAVSNGETNLNKGKILYPTILLCTKTDNYFIAELFGASERLKKLIIKRHLDPSVNHYLNQFNFDLTEEPLIHINRSKNIQFSDLILANESDLKEVEKRFPFVSFKNSSTLIRQESKGPAVIFGNDNYSATLINCIMVNTFFNAIRVKDILYMTVINKSFTKQRYLNELPQSIIKGDSLLGVKTCDNEKAEKLLVANQFTNIFLMNKLRETTIGEFLNTHPEILKRALVTKNFIIEAYLPWIDKVTNNTDKAINPDLLIEREDGYYDIYDLKTAALEKKSLTKGKRSRRRFIDYVNEGIAQLVNYEEYFKFPQNQQLAWEKYKVKIKSPNLVLIVGNFENINEEEVKEACRAFKNITIIDYDTLMQLFINSKRLQ